MKIESVPMSRSLLRELAPLAAESEAAGLGGLSRLQAEQTENLYQLPGEAFFTARISGELAGICGLNVCPYAGDPSVARLRRLYVAQQFRRQGIGRALVAAVIQAARPHFRELTVRMGNPSAAPFFAAMGFEESPSDFASHRLPLG